MRKEIRTHFWHYFFLLLIIGSGSLAFIMSPDKTVKFRIAALLALAYIFWGIIHHLLERNLKLKIVIEYSLIGLLGLILLGGALL